MKPFASFVALLAAALVSSSCGTPSSAPARLDLSGQWIGHGTDSQGAESFTWTLSQDGGSVAGMVTTAAADPTDGSCASCRKNKTGVVSGTMSGGALTVTMTFPTGGNVPTPICNVTMDASTTAVTAEQVVANYSGGDSCEGPFLNGAFTMVRK